jgi:DNA replication protein DnaC
MFIAHRYECGSVIITSNQPFSQRDHIFPDTMMTVASIDRIIHHATIVELEDKGFSHPPATGYSNAAYLCIF